MCKKPEPTILQREMTKKTLNDWLIVPGLGGIGLACITSYSSLAHGNYLNFAENAIMSGIFWTILANGNGWINDQVDKRWSWLETPIQRTVIGVLTTLIYTVLSALIVMYLILEFYYNVDFFGIIKDRGIMELLAAPLIITAVIALWLHGRSFLMSWRQSAIDVEKLKSENLKSQFESLKSQVNPHFLFNSLNALSSLVYDNQDRAVEFIQELSKVYRYVLDHQNDEVVQLSDELAFLKSYVYLNKIRFGDNLNVEYQGLDSVNQKWMIPPVALQMLMENVLKHNEISKDNHLNVVVCLQDDRISIQNNINPLQSRKEDSSGLGLNNIKARYKLLTDKSVEITESPEFAVTLPLLTVES